VFLFIILSIVIFITVYPLYYSLVFSLNDANDIDKNGFIYFFPRKFTLNNYRIVFIEEGLINAFLLTTVRTIVGTTLGVFFTAMVSYPLSRRNLIGRKIYIRIGIITMYFHGGLIPYYLVLRNLHLLNSFAVYIIPALLGFFNVIIFINFYNSLPDALEEAARIDGANDLYK
jgi:putative aldouronate transport system permease protein